jgi:hypothetical protein
MKVKNV